MHLNRYDRILLVLLAGALCLVLFAPVPAEPAGGTAARVMLIDAE